MRALTQEEIDFLLGRGEFAGWEYSHGYRGKNESKQHRRRESGLNRRMKNLGLFRVGIKGFRVGDQYQEAQYCYTVKGEKIIRELRQAYKFLDAAKDLKELYRHTSEILGWNKRSRRG